MKFFSIIIPRCIIHLTDLSYENEWKRAKVMKGQMSCQGLCQVIIIIIVERISRGRHHTVEHIYTDSTLHTTSYNSMNTIPCWWQLHHRTPFFVLFAEPSLTRQSLRVINHFDFDFMKSNPTFHWAHLVGGYFTITITITIRPWALIDDDTMPFGHYIYLLLTMTFDVISCQPQIKLIVTKCTNHYGQHPHIKLTISC